MQVRYQAAPRSDGRSISGPGPRGTENGSADAAGGKRSSATVCAQVGNGPVDVPAELLAGLGERGRGPGLGQDHADEVSARRAPDEGAVAAGVRPAVGRDLPAEAVAVGRDVPDLVPGGRRDALAPLHL